MQYGCTKGVGWKAGLDNYTESNLSASQGNDISHSPVLSEKSGLKSQDDSSEIDKYYTMIKEIFFPSLMASILVPMTSLYLNIV